MGWDGSIARFDDFFGLISNLMYMIPYHHSDPNKRLHMFEKRFSLTSDRYVSVPFPRP